MLDYQLLDMNARELVCTLRDEKIDSPFIVMTANDDDDSFREMMDLGALVYLKKNMDFFNLLPSVVGNAMKQLDLVSG